MGKNTQNNKDMSIMLEIQRRNSTSLTKNMSAFIF